MAGKKKSQRKAAADNEMSASHLANSACPRCHTEGCQAELFINCDICSCSYHGACTELNGDTFDVLMGIVHETGWVCKDCRLNSRQVIRGLQASCAKLAEQVAGLTVYVLISWRSMVLPVSQHLNKLNGMFGLLSETVSVAVTT